MPRHLEEVWLGALALLCACEVSPLPAYGNVLVQVDTDATVPALVDRLRVDIFDGSTWVSSRAFALPTAARRSAPATRRRPRAIRHRQRPDRQPSASAAQGPLDER